MKVPEDRDFGKRTAYPPAVGMWTNPGLGGKEVRRQYATYDITGCYLRLSTVYADVS